MTPDRLLELFEPRSNGCLIWHGYTTCHGYGRAWISLNGKKAGHQYVHRVMYEWESAEPIPIDMTVSHRCQEKLCGAFDHLELMTWEEHGAFTWDQEEGRVIWTPEMMLHELPPAVSAWDPF